MNIGRNTFTEKMTLEDLKSTGTIHWNKFEPPLADSTGVSTLASVLNAGSDANNVGITNLASLEVSTIDAASVLSAATKGTVGSKNVFTHCDFTADSNTFPSSIDDDTLADVMDRSSAAAPDNKASVGTNDLNMNFQIISNATSVGMQDCLVKNRIFFTEAEGTTMVGSGLTGHPTIASNFNFRDGTNNTFPADALGDLAQTMTLGNQVSTDLEMKTAEGNKKDILNAKTIGAITVGAQTIAASSSIQSATAIINGHLNVNAFNINDATLDFTGVAHPGGVTAIAIETNTGTSTGDPFVDVVYTLTSADNGTKYTYSGSGTGLTFTITTNSTGFNSVTSSAVAIDGNGIDFLTDETITITEAQMRLITSIGVFITTTVVLKLTANLGLTRIEGDDTTTLGKPNMTTCTFLDLSSTTNLLQPANESYEWMTVWTNASTVFPPPTGWRPYTAPQIPLINLVYFDFWSDRDSTKGWRYFAPQSDSDRQIDPDDKMELHEGEYIHGANNAAVWPYAFYGTTAATTTAVSSSQVVEFTFTSAQYGYGRIYAALAIQYSPFNTEPTVLENTFRLMMEHEGTALATNPRISGPTTMKWYIPNTFPTDGTQVRIFPMIRTDDAETQEGRLVIRIGNGQPLYGQNPGEPPDFTPVDTNAQQSQLILRGYPVPSQFVSFPSPPGVIP